MLTVTSLTSIKIITPKFNNSKQKSIAKPTLEKTKTISLCTIPEKCPIFYENIFGSLSFNYNNTEIQNWIKKINHETDKYYLETINSNTNNESCREIKDIYKYEQTTKTYYNNYIGTKYISLSVKRINTNFCTNKSYEYPRETIIYNIKKEKIITQEQLKQELNLTEEQIKSAIIKNMNDLNQMVSTDYNYTNYHLYYDVTGCLLAEYKLPNGQYYSAIIYE